jgi:MiaB-like tRNA modifying enzyme
MPSVFVRSFGCSANQADAEIAKGILQNNNYRLNNYPENADANLILTCIVKKPTEQKVVKYLKNLEKTGKPLVIAGCMPQAMQKQVEKIIPSASLVGPDDIEHVAEAVTETIKGHKVVFVDGHPTNRACFPRVRNNQIIHIAPISSGCLGNCSYCIVKNARGHLYSFPAKDIKLDTQNAINEGCKEIWVTAEDTAAFNDNGMRLPELLNMLCEIRGEFRIRIGMMTPNQAKPIITSLIEAMKREKIFKFIHIPIQSGNDEILKRMNRQYTVSEFNELVKTFRKAYQNIGISTDIICGFPGETEIQFQDSLDLIKNLRPDVLNISRFWERPGTSASEMKNKLHGRETKKRSRKLTSLWKKLGVDVGNKWLGWRGQVLIDEQGKNGTMVGRNYSYKTVVVKTDATLGDFVNVEVIDAGIGYLRGKIV